MIFFFRTTSNVSQISNDEETIAREDTLQVSTLI